MDKITAINRLNSKNATKEMLREALAWLLGVEYKPAKKTQTQTLFTQCRLFFCKEYEKNTGLSYYWHLKDALGLKQSLTKIEILIKNNNEAEIFNTFKIIVTKLPQWYKNNAFSIAIINSKFNEITAQIKKCNNAKNKITDSYKHRIIKDLFS